MKRRDYQSLSHDIRQIGQHVIASMTTMIPDAGTRVHSKEPYSCQSEIDIDGPWQGRIVVQVTPGLADSAARHMFGLPGPVADGDKLADAVDELTNIVAGNLKALLPPPSKLHMPGFTHEIATGPTALEVIIPTLTGDQMNIVIVPAQ